MLYISIYNIHNTYYVNISTCHHIRACVYTVQPAYLVDLCQTCQPFGSISVRVCVYGHVLMCTLVCACARYCSLYMEVKGPDLRQGPLSVAGYSRPTGLWTSGESPRSLFCLTIGA